MGRQASSTGNAISTVSSNSCDSRKRRVGVNATIELAAFKRFRAFEPKSSDVLVPNSDDKESATLSKNARKGDEYDEHADEHDEDSYGYWVSSTENNNLTNCVHCGSKPNHDNNDHASCIENMAEVLSSEENIRKRNSTGKKVKKLRRMIKYDTTACNRNSFDEHSIPLGSPISKINTDFYKRMSSSSLITGSKNQSSSLRGSPDASIGLTGKSSISFESNGQTTFDFSSQERSRKKGNTSCLDDCVSSKIKKIRSDGNSDGDVDDCVGFVCDALDNEKDKEGYDGDDDGGDDNGDKGNNAASYTFINSRFGDEDGVRVGVKFDDKEKNAGYVINEKNSNHGGIMKRLIRKFDFGSDANENQRLFRVNGLYDDGYDNEVFEVSDTINPAPAFILSSGRASKESEPSSKVLNIDDEFEQYFSKLLL